MGAFSRHKASHGLAIAVPDYVRCADGTVVETTHTGQQHTTIDYIDEDFKSDFKSPLSATGSSYSTSKHGSGASDFSYPQRKRIPRTSVTEIPPLYSRASSEGEEEDDPDLIYIPKRKWRSSRLTPGEPYEKPWKDETIPRRTWEIWIFASGCLAGLTIGTYLMFSAWTSVINSEYCNILIDDFQRGINLEVWNFEVQRGGFGSGTFEWTTYDHSNVYTDEAGLHIIPTLTLDKTDYTEAQLLDGTVLNLTAQGICTSHVPADCQVRSNQTSGAILNPVRSARLNTKGKMTLTYGRVEVVAKLPRGDWLWPAIWMMPETNYYGVWPRSGEIDIMEARGNAPPFPGGRNQVSSALHWGPISFADGYWRTLGQASLPRSDYSDNFHLYALEWSEKYLFMYLDSRLLQILYVSFPKNSNLWNKGSFSSNVNQSALDNPWPSDKANAPFDQAFYLILNVAVGGTNGFFVDDVGNKPWIDKAAGSQRAFWLAKDEWYPTWGEGDTRGLTVQSVKLYTLGACSNSTT